MYKKEFSTETYLTSLCKEMLGPHFQYVKSGSRTREGFIYCEHFYGKGFLHLDVDGQWNDPKFSRRRRYYPGAVARIEPDALIILDQTREKSEWNGIGGSYADSERIYFAQPNFLEKFMTIRVIHKKVCKAEKLRSDGMHRIIA